MNAAVTYRKTQQGEWVAFGPASLMRKGAVTVTKKDGSTKTEQVERTGKTFTVNGVPMVYGYLAKSAPAARQAAGKCDTCRCHREHNAGAPGTTLYDGCDRCGCTGPWG